MAVSRAAVYSSKMGVYSSLFSSVSSNTAQCSRQNAAWVAANPRAS